jgi:integrase
LEHLLNYWKQQTSPATKTFEEAKSIIKRLSSQVDNKKASRITKTDVVAYKDMVLENGRSASTIRKHLNLINAIFNIAVKNGKLNSNPASGVEPPSVKTKQKPRVPFSIEELRRIFSSPIYTANHRPKGGAGEASYWLPLLALWTGARLSEIGQLLVEDIAEDSGVKYINITTETSDDEDEEETQKSLKNS